MPTARLPLFYAGLAIVAVVVTVVVVRLAGDVHAQPGIAGGYDVAAGRECLGRQVDVRQSGQFVVLQRADGSASGRLRFSGDRLTGTATCLDGTTRPVRARVQAGTVLGRLGTHPLRAALARDPPAPGLQGPRAPGSVAGRYRVLPRSDCLGGRITLDGGGGGDEVRLGGSGSVRGRLRYAKDGGLQGRVSCSVAARRRSAVGPPTAS